MTEAERYAEELVDEILESLYNDGSLSFKRILFERAKEVAKIAVRRIIAALEEYDTRTETYLKKEFGQNYTSAELQNMEQDFRFYDKVLTAIDKY